MGVGGPRRSVNKATLLALLKSRQNVVYFIYPMQPEILPIPGVSEVFCYKNGLPLAEGQKPVGLESFICAELGTIQSLYG